MDFKYIKNQTDNTGDIFLFAPIGGGGINAQEFVNELRFLDSLELDEINVHINSPGGSVIDGFGIFSAIRNAKTPVNTIIEGIAASIAGIIAMAGHNRSIADFGRLMIHDPHFGRKAENEQEKNTLDSIKDSIITILSNNSSLDAEEIFNLMTEETWFNAEDAKAFGFVDNVFSTTREKETVNELAVSDIMNIASELVDTTPQITHVKLTQTEMLNLKNHLSLDAEATEIEIVDAVKVLENKINETEAALTDAKDEFKEEKEALNETVTTHENTIDGLNNEIATLIVENAINDGKFEAKNKEALIEKACADLEGFKTIVNAVTSAPVSINAMIDTTVEEPAKVTFNDMSKNDPTGLLNLMKNDWDKYSELYKEQYGVNPSK